MKDMPKGNINVLVVDDSAFMRKVISDILKSDPDITVIDTAKNGIEAIEKAKSLKPDVITLDVEMPVMDGLKCLKEILKTQYIPVLMLSSLTKDGAEATIKALENGAVDFIPKPTNIFEMTADDIKRELVDKVKIARTIVKGKKESTKSRIVKPREEIVRSAEIKNIVAIGTSTGGPRALQSVIPLIPGDIPAAVLIVQHMPPGFTRSLAERLNSMSELNVKEAEDKEVVRAGYAYIAPGDYHMLVEKFDGVNLRIKLTQDPPLGGHRPAVNSMMDSLSETGLNNIIAVIMTGMGGDGSEGIKKLKTNNKSFIIAQDEKTCVVYGMPKVAVQTGMVDNVAPLDQIANEIKKFVGVYR